MSGGCEALAKTRGEEAAPPTNAATTRAVKATGRADGAMDVSRALADPASHRRRRRRNCACGAAPPPRTSNLGPRPSVPGYFISIGSTWNDCGDPSGETVVPVILPSVAV